MRLPRSLTTRLVVTAVALVAVVGVLVGVTATLAMRNQLLDRLDAQVHSAVDRGPQLGPGQANRPFGLGPGAVVAYFPLDGSQAIGAIVPEHGNDALQLDADALGKLARVPVDGTEHSVGASGVDYRAEAVRGVDGVLVVGLPTTEVNRTLSQLMTWFALLTLAGVGIAGVAGTLLVRRQLAPLRAVAETARTVSGQQLDRGDTTIDTRVPVELTDPGTEVGQVAGALNTLLDHVQEALTARHRSEQQVRQFVADASHELRTPLATINGYAELSRRTPEDPEALLMALGKVETEAGRMSALVEDLLVLARLDSGRPLAQEEVDLTRLLLEAVADARVVAPDHTWRLDLPEEPVLVTGDAARLHQVVSNLLSNARTHTPGGTTITVRAEGGETTRIEVHDDGPGLSPELAEHAFERFTRGDGSRTRASGGAGLGLSLVSAIARAHGGSASVRSQPGDTTFEVSLPGARS